MSQVVDRFLHLYTEGYEGFFHLDHFTGDVETSVQPKKRRIRSPVCCPTRQTAEAETAKARSGTGMHLCRPELSIHSLRTDVSGAAADLCTAPCQPAVSDPCSAPAHAFSVLPLLPAFSGMLHTETEAPETPRLRSQSGHSVYQIKNMPPPQPRCKAHKRGVGQAAEKPSKAPDFLCFS